MAAQALVITLIFTGRSFLNKVGQVVTPRKLRLAVYRGGLEPCMRKVAWKHLLNVYPDGMTGGRGLSISRRNPLSTTH